MPQSGALTTKSLGISWNLAEALKQCYLCSLSLVPLPRYSSYRWFLVNFTLG